jgi:ABC-2 type transport system ATP-binding protein
VLNGVMMGLSRREAAARLDAVLDFAELRDFTDLKLKNYSSGMMVRLAFAVMVQADADVMLIDEVLAVGDASFTQKCMDVFRARRDAGRTIVLVTHDMATVQDMCHRAMLIHGSELQYVGDPDETAIRYYRLNFEGTEAHGSDAGAGGIPDVHTRLISAQLTDEAGRPVENIEQGRPIGIDLVFEARRDLVGPAFGVHVLTEDEALVFALLLAGEDGRAPERVAAGERVRIRGTMQNPLLPGRYSVNGYVFRRRSEGAGALQKVRLLDFLVYGTSPGLGIVRVDSDLAAVVEPEVTVS